MRPLLALFVRAFREHSRARTTYLARGFIGLMLLLLLWMAHETQQWSGAPGRIFFSYLVAINYVFATLAGLGICSGAIAEEKEEGTLGLLRMADLNAISILLGKGTGRLGILFLLIAVQIPFSFLSVTLGGVSVRQILTAYTLLGSYLFALANIALLFSVLLSRVWRATLASGIILVALCCLSDILGAIAGWLVALPEARRFSALIERLDDMSAWTASVNPLVHMEYLVQSAYIGLQVQRSVIAHLLIGASCFVVAWTLFERFARADSTEAASPRRSTLCRIAALRPPRPRTHAVAWKDFHFPFGGQLFFVGRLLAYPFVVAAFIWVTATPKNRNSQDIADTTWWFGWITFYIETTILTLCMWAPERWQLNLSSLVITPLSLRRIQAEKLKAFVIALLPSVIVVLSAMAIGGPKFIHYLFPANSNSWNTGFSFYSLGVIPDYVASAINLIFFLTLCLNLSLRLKWTTLPAALGILFFLQILLTMGFMIAISTISFSAPGGGFSSNIYRIARLAQLVLLAIASVFLWSNTQRQLTRLAAEA